LTSDTAMIRLEEVQTRSEEARIIPLPNVLVDMLRQVEDKNGLKFDMTYLRNEWQKACVVAGLGPFIKVEGKLDPRYTRLTILDLRRSAIKNMMKAGANEKVAINISSHLTREVFDRSHIVDTEDVVDVMRKVQGIIPAGKGLVNDGGNSVEEPPKGRRKKLLTI
jgi:hypothetical protein